MSQEEFAKELDRIEAFLRGLSADLGALRLRLDKALDGSDVDGVRAEVAAFRDAVEAFRADKLTLSRGWSPLRDRFDEKTIGYRGWHNIVPARHFPDWPPRQRFGKEQRTAEDIEAEWTLNPNQHNVARLREAFRDYRDRLVAAGATAAGDLSEAEVAEASTASHVELTDEGVVREDDPAAFDDQELARTAARIKARDPDTGV